MPLKFWQKIPFPYKLSAAIVLAYLLLVSLVSFYRLNVATARLREGALTRMRTVTNFLAISSSDAILHQRPWTLNPLLNKISRGEGILFAGVENRTGVIVAHTEPSVIGTRQRMTDDKVFPKRDNTFVLSAPVVFGNDTVATVRMGFSTRAMSEAIAAVRSEAVGLATVASFFGILAVAPLVWMIGGGRRRLLVVEEEREEVRRRADTVEIALRDAVEERNQTKRILDNLGQGIIHIDAENRIIFINPAAREMLGLRGQDIIRKDFSAAGGILESDAIKIYLKRALKGPPLVVESRLNHRPGRPAAWALINVNSQFAPEGKYQGAVMTLIDITERKRQEEVARKKTQELTLLHAITSIINHSLESDQVVNLTLDRVAEGMKTSASWIHLFDPASDRVWSAAHRGLEQTPVPDQDFYRQVLQKGETVVCEVIPADHPITRTVPDDLNRRSLVEIPLKAKGRVVGVLGILRPREEKVLAEDRQFFEVIGGQIGALIDHALAYEGARRESTTLAALQKAGEVLTSTGDFTDLLHAVTRQASELLSVSRAAYFSFNETLLELVGEAGYGVWDEEVQAIRTEPSPFALNAITDRQPAMLARIGDTERAQDIYFDRFDLKSVLYLPVIGREGVIGLLALDDVWESRTFTAIEVDLITTFLGQAAPLIERERVGRG